MGSSIAPGTLLGDPNADMQTGAWRLGFGVRSFILTFLFPRRRSAGEKFAERQDLKQRSQRKSRSKRWRHPTFADVKARTFLVSCASDWRYPAEELDEIRVALEQVGAPVELTILESPFGHRAFSHDSEGLRNLVREFLKAAKA